MSPFRFFANTARILFFVTAVTAVGILSVWIWAPHWVDRLDRYALKRYEKHFEKRYYQAVDGLQQTPAEAIPRMERFALSLEKVKKGDRLAQMKKVVLSQLVSACLRQGYLDKALFWAEEWLRFDPRDFDAMLTEVDVLLSTPEKKPLGMKKLLVLAETYPDVRPVTRRAIQAGLITVPRKSP